MELRNEKLDFWCKNGLNVLFIGAAGVGKTARVKETFERNNLRYKYFSAATMDPFCDFVGVPKVVKDEDGKEYLDYILPRDMRDGKVEAIFMDELNRAHKKVINAVMELLQFKSINGRPFPNLKVIWAAINPEDGEDVYQVTPLDKAQKGRFEVHVNVPFKPDREWFVLKYGEHLAKAALDWWSQLPEPTKKEIDPRRLEYALKVYKMPNGDMRDVLPEGCNVAKLINTISNGPAIDRMVDFFNNKDYENARKYLAVENNYAAAAPHLLKPQGILGVSDPTWFGFFLPLLASEKLSSLIATEDMICNHMLSEADSVPIYRRVMQDILAANTNKKLCRRISKVLGDNKTMAQQYGFLNNQHPVPAFFNANSPHTGHWSSEIIKFIGQPMGKTPQRMKIYAEMANVLPPVLSAQEAIETLELLNITAGRCWKDTLHDMCNLSGVWNHCIEQLHKTTGLSWLEILNLHGTKFETLLKKITEAKLDCQLYCPLAKKSITDLVMERNDALFANKMESK